MSPDLKPIENDAELQVQAEPDQEIQKQIEAFPGIAMVHLRQSQEKEALDRNSSYKLERKRVSGGRVFQWLAFLNVFCIFLSNGHEELSGV